MLTVIEKVIFLQNVDAFSEVSTEHMAYLAAIAEEQSIPKDGVIYKEEDSADGMYLVLDGRIRLQRRGVEISTVGSQEAFGTWSLFDEEPRVVTATTLEETRLLRIGREDFIDLLSDHVHITQGILKAMAKRLRSLIEGSAGRMPEHSSRTTGSHDT